MREAVDEGEAEAASPRVASPSLSHLPAVGDAALYALAASLG